MYRFLTCVVVLSLALGMGCQKKVAVHPGAVSNLDSYSYDILLVEQDVIAEARAQYEANKLPEGALSYLRVAITQYNVTQAAWHAYHDQHAGNDTALQDAVNSLVAAVAELQRALGKTAAPVPTGALMPHLDSPVTLASCYYDTGNGVMEMIACGGRI